VGSEANGKGKLMLRPFVLVLTAIVVFSGGKSHHVGIQNAHAENPKKVVSVNSSGFANPLLLYTLGGHAATIKSLAFSPNGRILATAGSENDGRIGLWDTLTGKAVGIIRKAHRGAIQSMLISPDGRTLVSASNDNVINTWNLRLDIIAKYYL
jgi:WD40 repeat protein